MEAGCWITPRGRPTYSRHRRPGQRPVLIFADGGVRSGSDVLKLLALGADAVLVGRPLVIGVMGGGREGVALLAQ